VLARCVQEQVVLCAVGVALEAFLATNKHTVHTHVQAPSPRIVSRCLHATERRTLRMRAATRVADVLRDEQVPGEREREQQQRTVARLRMLSGARVTDRLTPCHSAIQPPLHAGAHSCLQQNKTSSMFWAWQSRGWRACARVD
jgi:hypothetical protein